MTKFQHLLNIKQLNQETLFSLLDRAQQYLTDNIIPNKVGTTAQGQLVANLFFEPSTRTCNSFEIAAKRLSALTISPHMQSSSLLKGETILDTVQTIEAMGANLLVIRHEEHGIMQQLASEVKATTHIINAGEGWLNHPTQALLDLLTIRQHKSKLDSLKIAIVGDLFHSRVAHSLVDIFALAGVSDLRLIAPKQLTPEDDMCTRARTVTTDLAQGLDQVDVIISLRLQKERMSIDRVIPEKDFIENYQISTKTLKFAKPDAIVMHPGPINREIEISSSVADSPQSVILQQVQNGVAIRMAVLSTLLES